MKIKDIVSKPKTEDQIKKDDEYHEYGHKNFTPTMSFEDAMTISSFDQGDMRKKIKSLAELDED